MTPDEKEELNEIRQILEDVLQRADRFFIKININDDLAHMIKAMVNMKIRMTVLAEGKLKLHTTDNGAWP